MSEPPADGHQRGEQRDEEDVDARPTENISEPIQIQPKQGTDDSQDRNSVDEAPGDADRSSAEGESEVEEELEEEDLELLQENLGRSGFRRLQQRGSDSTEDGSAEAQEEHDDDDYEEEDSVFIRRKRATPEELERLFDEDEKTLAVSKSPGQDRSLYNYEEERELFSEDDDGMADFIEDEDEEKEETVKDKSAKGKARDQNKDERRVPSTKAFLTETFGGKLTPHVLRDILEVFGDGTDYDGLVEDEDTKTTSQQDKTRNNKKHKDYPRQETKKANELGQIKNCDIPERMQLRDGPNRPLPEPGELEIEASWIMARWLRDPATGEKFAKVDHSSLNLCISAVLRQFREHKLEVPAIATHRKEHFQHLLGLNDLWTIWDHDEHWKVLKRQQAVLLSQVNDPSVSINMDDRLLLVQVVDTAESLEILDVACDYLRQAKKNQPGDEGILQAIEIIRDKFCLPVPKFIENIQHQQPLNLPPQPDEDLSALIDLHLREINGTGPQLQNVLISHVANYLGHHPHSHLSIRYSLENIAAVTVFPTEKGLSEIDSQHELSPLKYITEKPVNAFQNDQFLLVLKGQNIGLLKYEIVFPPIENFVESFVSFFGGSTNESQADEWSLLRGKCLRKAIYDLILPNLKREIESKLRTTAEKWVATTAQYVLQDKLMTMPYNPNKSGHPGKTDKFRVVAVSCGDGNLDAAGAAVVVDERGRVIEQLTMSRLHHRHRASNAQEWQKFKNLILEHDPSCVIVAGKSLYVLEFYRDIEKEVERLGKETSQSMPALLYGDDDTARIYMNGQRAKNEWPDSSPLCRYCISVGRRWVNPLFELCALTDTELQNLDSNPVQSLVAKDLMASFLHRAFVNVVNLVGIEINQAVSSTWMRSPLKYICGLGPIKAEALVRAIVDKSSGKLAKRADLLNKNFLGPCIYSNCASFLRIHQEIASKKAAATNGELLDNTRVHPENYILGRKMAADALEISLEDEQGDPEQVANRAILLVMQDPARLNDLLLDEYAKELVKRGQSSKHLTLLDIKAELQNPYFDLRIPSQGPSAETIFEMLTGENERTIWVGAPVRVTVLRSSDRVAICKLESGLIGILPERSDRFRMGQCVMATVASIDLQRMQVNLLEKRPTDPVEPRYVPDPYYDYQRAQVEIKSSKKREQSTPALTRPSQRRIISHPAFRDVSRSEAEQILQHAVLGEVLIRPSGTHGPDHLSLTWKIDDDDGRVALFQHLDIVEKDRSTGISIGRRLVVGGETFEDLDEIVARLVEPIAAYLRDVRATPKFIPLTTRDKGESRDQIEAYLQLERRREPNRIAYCLTLSRESPGNILISYQPSSKTYHELVDVLPRGFFLRGKNFDRVESLVAWFKQHYRDDMNTASRGSSSRR